MTYRADLAKAQRVHNGHAEVYRLASDTAIGEEGSLAGWLAVKVVSAYSNRPPHDVRQEVALLRRLRDPHLVRLVTSYLSDSHDHHLVLPYYPLPLDILLASDRFTPARLDESPFSQVVKAIIRQASSGLAYLHEQGIAHRDVKPGNLVIGSTGRLVLIDLGTAHDTKSSSNAERPGSMVFDVGSGSYKAPEVLFGSRDYDAFALDLWALGATLAELFCPLIETTNAASDDDDWRFSDDEDVPPPPPPKPSFMPKRWRRSPLFGTYVGDIALIGRIFKIVGTPEVASWPEAASLPDFGKVHFKSFPPTALADSLPHLPLDMAAREQIVALLAGLLDVSATRRWRAAEIARLDWLSASQGVDLSETLSSFMPAL